MKVFIMYSLAVGAVILFGGRHRGSDIGMLKPVEVVMVSGAQSGVEIVTDTQDKGTGNSVEAAIENMKQGATGEIFLETADYLLIAEGCEHYLDELAKCLRPSCGICTVTQKPDLAQIARYLKQHPPELTLGAWRAGRRSMPTLIVQKERIELVP